MSPTTIKTGLAAAVIALAISAPATAFAGDSFTFSLSPRGDSADLIRQGLQIYGIVNDLKGKKNHARVDQKGINNVAAVSQKGTDNYGLVYQRGRDHTATLAQAGRNNAYGVFQFGRRTNVDVAQTGTGDVGLIFQGGW
jgi:Curlin associated repeat